MNSIKESAHIDETFNNLSYKSLNRINNDIYM